MYATCLQAEVVALDEREGGVRATLNLGHTFGHAVETHTGYGSWLHGEAVSAGTVMAADLSYRLGWIEKDLLDRCGHCFGLPFHCRGTLQLCAQDILRTRGC